MNFIHVLKPEKDLKRVLTKLHIDYINYCASVSREASFNFWGITDFRGYIRQFGPGHVIIQKTGIKNVLDMAAEIGYDLDH